MIYDNFSENLLCKICKKIKYKNVYGEFNHLTLEKRKELDLIEDEIKKLYSKINQLVVNHVLILQHSLQILLELMLQYM